MKKDRRCLQCGKKFTSIRITNKFCSATCRTNYQKYLIRKKLEAKPCLNCGETFKPRQCKSNFCSTTCYKKYRNRIRQEKSLKEKFTHGDVWILEDLEKEIWRMEKRGCD